MRVWCDWLGVPYTSTLLNGFITHFRMAYYLFVLVACCLPENTVGKCLNMSARGLNCCRQGTISHWTGLLPSVSWIRTLTFCSRLSSMTTSLWMNLGMNQNRLDTICLENLCQISARSVLYLSGTQTTACGQQPLRSWMRPNSPADT